MKQSVFTVVIFSLGMFQLYAFQQEGVASWYGGKFHGRKTASGEVFDTNKMTAAHKNLPFGTIVTVVNTKTGKRTQVRINDRGPYAKGRVIDLSYAAAKELGLLKSGTGHVRLIADPKVKELINLCNIQVGAYKNLKNAARLKKMLTDAGFTPYAVMTKDGVIRIEIKNVPKEQVEQTLVRLRKLGIQNPLVKQ
jgi:rare lipoprotein A